MRKNSTLITSIPLIGQIEQDSLRINLEEDPSFHQVIARDTFFLTNSSLLYITVDVDGKSTQALVDSGAPVALMNKSEVDERSTFSGDFAYVHSYSEKKHIHDNWRRLHVTYQDHPKQTLQLWSSRL